MFVTLDNGIIEVAINTRGAEIFSMKKNGDEYIWQRDPKYWKGCAPVLFPMVSSMLDEYYIYKGEKYPFPSHGFARDCVYDVVEQSETSVVLRLVQNHLTKLLYPFKYDFCVSFALDGSKMDIKYIVNNTSKTETMYFNTGSHEAYNLFGATVDDHYIEFEKVEQLVQYVVEDPVWEGKKRDFGEADVLELKEEYFAIDGVFFVEIKSNHVTLRSKSSDKAVRVYFDCDKLGVWKPPGAGFLCMEPWDGFCPFEGDSHDITEKRFIKSLAPESEYVFNHSIEII